MSKTEADGIKKISTNFLKKHKYFDGLRSGTITWTSGGSEHKSSVSIEVSTLNDGGYLRIYYTQTDNYTGEKKDFDYKIPLTTTRCQYGGKRYWFICPMFKNGNYCGQRVGTIYKDGDYFACRHCYNLTYESRKLSGMEKSFGRIISLSEVEKARDEVKRIHYKGKPTKKYLRYLRLEERSEESFVGMAWYLTHRTNGRKRR